MSKVKVVLNKKGFRELLKSAEMESLLGELAEGISGRCGDGYASDTYQAQTRAISSVYTETPDAMRDNLKNNTIMRGLHA